MGSLTRSLGSSVGLKFLAAITGLFLVLFVIGHMLGNLQVFLGPEALNSYAAKLQGLGAGLWVVRAGLLAVFVLHVGSVGWLQARNWSARPLRYQNLRPLKSTFASRTMIWTGLLLLAFILYHLLHFTIGLTNPSHFGHLDEQGRHDVYEMVILGFRDPGITIAYVLAMVVLFFHLKHGIGSMFQSMGWNDPKYERLTARLGQAVAAVLLVGNISMPLLVLFGAVGSSVGGN